jgi:Rho-binding antiterminator
VSLPGATMSDYTPVDCGLHSEYELAIMHHRRLRLTWEDIDGQMHLEIVTPTDLLVRQHEEFLVVRIQSQQILELRLDRIRSATVLR